MKLAEKLDAPVCVGYQHNDAFPGKHPLTQARWVTTVPRRRWSLYKKQMWCWRWAQGSIHSPPTWLWPRLLAKDAKIIQVDINPSRIGLTKKIAVGIVGDSKKVAIAILAKLSAGAGDHERKMRKDLIATTKSKWAQQLSSMDHENDDPGTTWNERRVRPSQNG